MLVSVHDSLLSLGIVQLLAESFDLLLVCGADRLQLNLDGVVKLFFVSANLGLLEVLLPSLEHVSHLLDFASSISMLKDLLGMLFEFSVFLQGSEASHLHDLHARHRLPFARPQSHYLTSQRVLLRQLRLLRQLLLQLFNFSLLGV